MSTPQILIVSKTDSSKHARIPQDVAALPALGPSSVRVRTVVLSFGRNMLFYVRANPWVDWTTAYPVPPTAPVPSGSPDEWCVSKTWGYGEVVESTMEKLPKGTILTGWFPVSSGQHDLKLEPSGGADSDGNYLETSEERSAFFKIARQYQVAQDKPDAWKASLRMLWGTSYLIHQTVFPENNGEEGAPAPCYTLGPGAGEWTTEDADLTSTVVIALSTSSKTGRSFTYQTLNRTANKPLAYLSVSSSSSQADVAKMPADNTKKIEYQSLTAQDTLDWIAKFNPSRILLADFGARGQTMPEFLEKASAALGQKTALKKITLLMIGTPPDIRSDQNLPNKVAEGVAFEKHMINHSGMQGYAEDNLGPMTLRREWHEAFDKWTEEGWADDVKLVEARGLEEAEKMYDVFTRDQYLSPSESWAAWM